MKHHRPHPARGQSQFDEQALIPQLAMPLSDTVQQNESNLRGILSGASDAVFRTIRANGSHPLLVVYVDGLVDSKQLEEAVLQPCLQDETPRTPGTAENALDHVAGLIAVGDIKRAKTFGHLVHALLNGSAAVIVHGCSEALLANLPGWETRAIEEASSESGIRGPREGFTESLRTNTSMIRRRLRTPLLKMELVTLGRISRTNIVITYVDGVVDRTVLQEAKRRISAMQVDMVLDSHYVEDFIEDVSWSPFPQVLNTERPDVVAASLFEGKVGILVDGSPHTLIVPMTLWSGLQSSEDYYERSVFSSPIRWLRYFLLFVAVTITPTYIALTTFHPEMLPTNLLLNFAAAREPSPVPTAIEALVMDLLFEGLREAGVRLPRNVGPAVSIVGGLVLGQAAVDAGIVSAPVVIVVAASGVASFTIPRYSFSFSFRLLRFPVLLLASVLGLYGITVSFLAILIHQVNLESFGVPYMSPVAPWSPGRWRDVILPSARRSSMVDTAIPDVPSGSTAVHPNERGDHE